MTKRFPLVIDWIGSRFRVAMFFGMCLVWSGGFSAVACGQNARGAGRGTVTAPTGAVVPGATVTVKHLATGDILRRSRMAPACMKGRTWKLEPTIC